MPTSRSLLAFAAAAMLPLGAAAQSAEPRPLLTEDQVNNVLSQLKILEEKVSQMRGATLATVLAKLRAASASPKDAMALYMECDNLVNSQRKEADRADAKRRQEMLERNFERKSKSDVETDGDTPVAVKLGVDYLILTLEAHETAKEDMVRMVPKLEEYIKSLLAAAGRLKGRAQGVLAGAVTDRNPIVEAFHLGRFLAKEGWSQRPNDVGSIYAQAILPLAQEKPESLPGIWDARITAEATFRKETLPAPEHAIWLQNELPVLKWQRAKYLYEKGPSPVLAMADMLSVLKENPGHADAPGWVAELRQCVNKSAPAGISANLSGS